MGYFETNCANQVHFITCPEEIDHRAAREMEDSIAKWSSGVDAALHVFDFRQTFAIHVAAYRVFVNFQKSLQSVGRSLFSMNMSHMLQKQVRENGLISTFSPVKSLEEAHQLHDRNHDGPYIDVELLNPFITGVQVVFLRELAIRLEPASPYLHTGPWPPSEDVVALLDVNCPQFQGGIALCLTESAALQLAPKKNSRSKTEKKESSPVVLDQAVELLMKAFRHGQNELINRQKFKWEMQTPELLSQDLKDESRNESAFVLVVPFQAGTVKLQMEVHVSKNQRPNV